MEITKAHTQNSVTVYVDNNEKEEIRNSAKLRNKSMSKYLLDLHNDTKFPTKGKNQSDVTIFGVVKEFSIYTGKIKFTIESCKIAFNNGVYSMGHVVVAVEEKR